MLRIAKCRGRLLSCARPRNQPIAPIIPPGSVVRLRRGEPCLSFDRKLLVKEELGLAVAWRVDDALDMTAGAQDEFSPPAQQPRRRIACLPRGDVVGGAADD